MNLYYHNCFSALDINMSQKATYPHPNKFYDASRSLLLVTCLFLRNKPMDSMYKYKYAC